MATKIVSFLAYASVASTGLYGVSATRAVDALPVVYSTFMAEEAGGAPSGPKCRVDVVRSGEAGVANVTRSALSGGECVCTVTTGPEASNGAAEQVVSALLRDKTCDGAPPPAESANAMAGGGSGMLLPAVVGGASAAGLAVSQISSSEG